MFAAARGRPIRPHQLPSLQDSASGLAGVGAIGVLELLELLDGSFTASITELGRGLGLVVEARASVRAGRGAVCVGGVVVAAGGVICPLGATGAGMGFCTGAVATSAQPATNRGAKKTNLMFQTSLFAWRRSKGRPSRNR
ncbi:hypothetical protein A3747_00500 [Sulfitobacter sp. HI0076]|nr:hypothetical protein A3747_00500 [Sulfitobacter sp. HI0076]